MMTMTRKRALSFLLAFALFLSCLPAGFLMDVIALGKPVSVTQDGEKVTAVTLPQDDKVTLTADLDGLVAKTYQWQIQVDKASGLWVDIAGHNCRTSDITYAVVGSLLDRSGRAQIRCAVYDGKTTHYSDPVTVTVSYKVQNPVQAATTQVTRAPARRMLQAARAAEDSLTQFTIVINYLYLDGSVAADPWVGRFAAGSEAFDHTVTSPVVVGYAPFFDVDMDGQFANGERADSFRVQFADGALTENRTYNIYYVPQEVSYYVTHYFQNVDNDQFTAGETTTESGITGTPVGACRHTHDGFTPMYFELIDIAADGSTHVEMYFERNYYLINFDLDGGYGTDPEYLRYQDSVGINHPVRPGYTFMGWELVEYDGGAPSPSVKQQYEAQINGQSVTVPNANLKFRAKWQQGNTHYTVVYWKENANDTSYTYWGSETVGLGADGNPDGTVSSGLVVNAVDYQNPDLQLDEMEHFTFHPTRSDAGVIVEGDGSTVVNVYFRRNVYTIRFVGSTDDSCGYVEHTHDDTCWGYDCGHVEHTHIPGACLSCTETVHEHDAECCDLPEHTHVTGTCCTLQEHFHTKSCYGISESANGYDREEAPAGNGYIILVEGGCSGGGDQKYVYFNGYWYRYNGDLDEGDVVPCAEGLEEHTHGDENCQCTQSEHAHGMGMCNGGDCGLVEHVHSDAEGCYGECEYDGAHSHTDDCVRYTCLLTEHTHGTGCDTNLIRELRAKYDSDISYVWEEEPVKGYLDKTDVFESNQQGNYKYSFLEKMPDRDIVMTRDNFNGNTKFSWGYYLEALPGEAGTEVAGGKTYNLYHTTNVTGSSGLYLTKNEDYFPITGFTQRDDDVPDFENNEAKLYYIRNQYTLEFYNYGNVPITDAGGTFYYQESIQETWPLTRIPDYPVDLEPGAFYFEGWYTTPECYPESKFNFQDATMPANDLALYAHWTPKTHTITVYEDATMTEDMLHGPVQSVPHGNYASVPSSPVRDGYEFVGWFYVDENGDEKAFDFSSMPVTQTMDVYAKWNSMVAVQYTVYYVTEIDGVLVDVADPTLGSTMAGRNKTFHAKGGEELYPQYQQGYFPKVNSHTIMMHNEEENTFTFVYESKPFVNYTVRYFNVSENAYFKDENGVEITTTGTSNAAVVTPTFKAFPGYMPDAYQKRLVLSADDSLNEVTFYYTEDSVNGYYQIIHYVQNVEGEYYTEFQSTGGPHELNTAVTADKLTITGFHFARATWQTLNQAEPTEFAEGAELTQNLTADGLLIEVYYDRDIVEYTLEHRDIVTGKLLTDSIVRSGRFGATGVGYASHFAGYTLVGDLFQKFIVLQEDSTKNEIVFYYQEQYANIQYEIVGSPEGGYLSQDSENVGATTGSPQGSEVTVYDGYRLEGWYLDRDCTRPIAGEPWVVGSRLIPQKEADGLYKPATYYAKIVPGNTSMTITKQYPEGENYEAVDPNQTFIFLIEGTDDKTQHITLRIVLKGNTSKTINELPIGSYKITEVSGWSWRYQVDGEAVRNVELQADKSANAFAFTNTRQGAQWLDGNAYCENEFN